MLQVNDYAAENGLLIISRIVCMGMLAGLSATDLKSRRISGSILMIGSILAAGYALFAGGGHIGLAIEGLLTGLIFVLVSKVTREQLGYGDSWLLCILGTYLGIWKLLELMAIAWIAVALAAVAVLALHKCRRGAVLPMVPFITAGYIVMWVGELFQ